MGAPVVHFEIAVKDGDKGRKFYSKVFDWNINVVDGMNYGMVDPDEGGISGGIMQAEEGKFPPYVTLYMLVDDIQKYLDRAVALGAHTIAPPTEIPGMGWYGLFKDPDGNLIGLWQK